MNYSSAFTCSASSFPAYTLPSPLVVHCFHSQSMYTTQCLKCTKKNAVYCLHIWKIISGIQCFVEMAMILSTTSFICTPPSLSVCLSTLFCDVSNGINYSFIQCRVIWWFSWVTFSFRFLFFFFNSIINFITYLLSLSLINELIMYNTLIIW